MKLLNLGLIKILLVVMLVSPALGALLYDGDKYRMDYGPSLILPDGDWAFGCWIKFTSRAGTSTRYIFMWNNEITPLMFVRIGDASAAIAPNDVNIAFIDNDGTNISYSSTGDYFLDNTSWTHLLMERSGNTITTYVNGSSVASGTNAGFDAIDLNAVKWTFGNDLYWSVPFLGDMADCAKWDRALSTAEKSSLIGGASANCIKGFQWFNPMIADKTEIKAGLEVFDDFTSVSAHPRLMFCN